MNLLTLVPPRVPSLSSSLDLLYRTYVTLICVNIELQFWNMFGFFVRVNLFQDSSLLDKTSEGIFFG